MTMVVGSVTETYLPLLALWLEQSAVHLPGEPTIVAMDAPSWAQLRNNARVHAVPAAGLDAPAADRQSFWGRRLREIRRVTAGSAESIHCDADAFWLASPLGILAQIDADMIFTRDHGIPKNITAAWGFTLCCGWFVLRRGRGVTAVLERWQQRTDGVRDDQIAFNRMVWSARPQWREARAGDVDTLTADVQIDGYALRIAVLPYNRFTRQPPFASPGAIIAHPFFERRFFNSYIALYRDLLDERGRLDGWQAVLEVEAFSRPSPVRDRASYELLDRAIAQGRSRPAWLSHRGNLLLRYGAREAARADLESAWEQGDASPATVLGLAEIRLLDGRAEDAAGLLLALAAYPDLETPVLRECAELALRHRRYGMLAHLGGRSLSLFGTGWLIRNGRSWLQKKRSKAL